MDRDLTKMQGYNIDNYLIKSGDTFEEFMDKNPKSKVVDLPAIGGWIEYCLMDDIFWIHTAFSNASHKKTLIAWKAVIKLAKKEGCTTIQFATVRNPKAWERLFKTKPVEWRMELDLTKEQV